MLWIVLFASDTRSMLLDIGTEPRTTPVRSPQSNGMVEAVVKTFKRDYVSVNSIPDAKTVIATRFTRIKLWDIANRASSWTVKPKFDSSGFMGQLYFDLASKPP